MRHSLTVLLVTGVPWLGSCDHTKTCTLADCVGTLLIEVRGLPRDLGRYELSVDGAGVTESCGYDVVGPADSESPVTLCDSSVHEWQWPDDGALQFQIMLARGQHPPELSIRLLRDASPLVDAQVMPDYSGPVYPNGEECDDEGCYSATVVLDGS